jgi:transketolase
MKDLNSSNLSENEEITENQIEIFVKRALTSTLILANTKGDAHVVSCLGTIQILCNILANNFNPKIDQLVISKGHAALALYSVLNEFGIIDFEELRKFRDENSQIGIHITNGFGSYSRLSSGSLGHGIGFGTGLALAKKLKNENGNIYVIVGDGELNEGSNYEALQIASTLKLGNLTVIVDHNHVQSVANYEEVAGKVEIQNKFKAFNWSVEVAKVSRQINEFLEARDPDTSIPNCIVYFSNLDSLLPELQNKVLWHYRRPDLSDVEKAFEVLNSNKVASDYVEWFRSL